MVVHACADQKTPDSLGQQKSKEALQARGACNYASYAPEHGHQPV